MPPLETMVMQPESLCCLGPYQGAVYVTMVQALHLDSHIGAVRRVHLTFIFWVLLEMHKLEFALKLRDNTSETGKIPAGETGV